MARSEDSGGKHDTREQKGGRLRGVSMAVVCEEGEKCNRRGWRRFGVRIGRLKSGELALTLTALGGSDSRTGGLTN